MNRHLSTALLMTTLAACGGKEASDHGDAGLPEDAGSADAGPVDAGLVDAGTPESLVFSGAVDSTAAYGYPAVVAVGAVTRGTSIALYSCGGAASYATDSHWFIGATNADGTFTINSDGWVAVGSVAGAGLSGQLTNPGGTVLTFNLPLTGGSDGEGLFSFAATASGCRTGVITWVDSLAGMQFQGTWCDGMDDFAQVIPVIPADVDALGFEAEAMTPAGETQFFVSPAVTLLGG